MVTNILQRCTVLLTVCVQVLALNSLQGGKPGCRPTADVIFLLDGSDSISDEEFNQQRHFIRRFIQLSDVGPDVIRVGLTVISSVIGDEVPLSFNSSKADLLHAVDSLTQPQEGSRTDLGLIEMEQLFGVYARRGVPRIGVVLTDGRAKYIRATEAEARVVKDAGIFLIAVGVGRLIKFTELEKIASTKSNAYSLDPLELSTKYLIETIHFIGQESCTGLQLVNRLGVGQIIDSKLNSTDVDTVNIVLRPDLTQLDKATKDLRSHPVISANDKSILASGNRVVAPGNSGLRSDKSGGLSLNAYDVIRDVDTGLSPVTHHVQSVNHMTGNSMKELTSMTGIGVNTSSTGLDILAGINGADINKLAEMTRTVLNEINGMAGPGVNTVIDTQLQNIATHLLAAVGDLNTATASPPWPTQTVQAAPLQTRSVMVPTPPRSFPLNEVTPTPVVTVAAPTMPPVEITYVDNIPSPTETANIIIQSLVARISPSHRAKPPSQPTRDISKQVTESQMINPVNAASVGVKVNLPGPSAAETLDFVKRRIKPPRTVEEHLNPIFRMFDGGPGSNKQNIRIQTPKSLSESNMTTISPLQAYMRAQLSVLKDQCSKGRFADGVAYTFKPGSCTEFLQCQQEKGGVQVQVATCPFETFFDDQHSVCRHHEEQICWTDPCADKVTVSYGHNSNCRAYWACERGHSVPVCCPSGTSYVAGFGCARNVTCTDTCMDFGNLKSMIQASQCKLLSMDMDPHYYFEFVAGMGWVVRMCASGSMFEQAYCKCIGTSKDKCGPELYMDFQGGLVDISGNNLSLGVYNVHLDGGTAAFYANSHLKLWRFSGMSLGQHVTISFRFRTSVTAPKGKLMHLISNCCHNCKSEPSPSLNIAIIPGDQGGVAVLSTTTREAGETFLFVPFKDTFTGWNSLVYSYDGIHMTGTVNDRTAQKPIVGDIEGKPDPLLIGACGTSNAYDGFMDELKFYMCNP